MNRDALLDLKRRLEEATGPDRTIDGEIALAFSLPQNFFNSFETDVDGYLYEGFKEVDGPECFNGAPIWSGGGRSWTAAKFTASIDATLALAARQFPEWDFAIECVASGPEWDFAISGRASGRSSASLSGPDHHKNRSEYISTNAASAALALCLALVIARLKEVQT